MRLFIFISTALLLAGQAAAYPTFHPSSWISSSSRFGQDGREDAVLQQLHTLHTNAKRQTGSGTKEEEEGPEEIPPGTITGPNGEPINVAHRVARLPSREGAAGGLRSVFGEAARKFREFGEVHLRPIGIAAV